MSFTATTPTDRSNRPDGAVVVVGVTKRYGDELALAGVDLSVPSGSVTAVLGPNGAGKSTLVRILTTLSPPDRGRATVAGFDVASHRHEVRRRIGLAAQDTTVDHLLTGTENLVMIGELHQMPRRVAAARAAELLDRFSLSDAADRPSGTYSGGMRRRLDLAAAVVAHPHVLFLDEPTTGLDPRARQELWAVLDDLVAGGTTLLLTTQYLEEAERLADQVVVIDHGRVVAEGDAREVARRVGGDHVHVVVTDPSDLHLGCAVVEQITGTPATVDASARTVTAATSSGVGTIVAIADALSSAGIDVDDLGLRQPSLDEAFLALTGTSAPPPELDDPSIVRAAPDRHRSPT